MFSGEGEVKAWTPTDLLDEIIKEQASFSVHFKEDVPLETRRKTIEEGVRRLSAAMQNFTESHMIPAVGKSLTSVLWIVFSKEGKALGCEFYFVVSEPSAVKDTSAFALSSKPDNMVVHIVARDIDRTKLATGMLANMAGGGWGTRPLTADALPSPSH
jgi:hypothetical protein